jgi:hypothetical protein
MSKVERRGVVLGSLVVVCAAKVLLFDRTMPSFQHGW